MSSELPWIVSVDDHVVEPCSVWTDRLPKSRRNQGPHVVREHYRPARFSNMEDPRHSFEPSTDGPLTDFWVYEDDWTITSLPTACAGVRREDLEFRPISYDEMRSGCYEPRERLRDMDINHVEASLCYPNYARFCGQIFLNAKDKALAYLCVRAYNDWLIDEWCGDSGGRLLPVALVPLWDVELAASEALRNAERGCRAIAFSEMPPALGLPSIHDRDKYWDPLFQACNDSGTVICMHIGSSSKLPITSTDAPAGVALALTFTNNQASLADWLLSGVLARFTDLKIAYAEGQVGWMPFLLERLDKLFVNAGAWSRLEPSIAEYPSSYFKDRVYGCMFDDDIGLSLRETIGIGQIMMETDYPHADSTWPNSWNIVGRWSGVLSSSELSLVVRDNAINLFRIDARQSSIIE